VTEARNLARPRQLPLDLGHAPGLSRDDLIVSKANAEAVALLDAWPNWTTTITLLAGPTGSGKSHICAVWQEVSGAHRANARQVTGADIEAAATGPVLVDDVDRGPIDESGLFHLLNAARQAGSHVLLASRRFPAAWGLALADLASRLRTAATIEIGEPDDALLTAVVTKLFADRQLEIEPQIVQFIVRRMERSLSTAIRIVDELDRIALANKSRVTRSAASEVMAALEDPEGT
jgi:chromosomal replication initiation ATPase DnaA